MSYAKVPLSDVEAAPVPSLHELQCELSKIPEESTHPAAVASKAEEVSLQFHSLYNIGCE